MEATTFLALKNDLANQIVDALSTAWGISRAWVIIILLVVVLWELFWKLSAMWKSARKSSPIWFVVLALVNTLGILPILYIYIFSEMKPKNSKQKPPKKKSRKKKRK